jgi:hypothetical protein
MYSFVPQSYEHTSTSSLFDHSSQLDINTTNARIPTVDSGWETSAPDTTAAARLSFTKVGPQFTFTAMAAEG